MDTVILAGYPYEFVGLLYFVFFLLMGRKRYDGIYTLRSRILTLIAAMVMVGCVPFNYSAKQEGIVAMFAVAIISMISARRRLQQRREQSTTPQK